MEHTLPADLVTATPAVVAVAGLLDGRTYFGPAASRWEKSEKLLWDLLSVRSNPDGSPRMPLLLFQKLGREQGFALKKVRNLNAPITPRGILKANWIHKHKLVLPSLLVMFFHYESNDPDWREKDSLVINEVLERKKSLQDRGIKVVVALVSISDRDDAKSTQERINQLRIGCGLDWKTSLYVCPPNTNLRDFVISLEKGIYEQACSYYREQGKRVKALKDKLAKGQHLELQIRYNFKIGMYAELRQDQKAAIKYYENSYSALLEYLPQARTPLRLTEAKMVAEYINYKICKLQLYNNVSDAVDQFQRHIRTFNPLTGPEVLLHEHWFFIAKQFRSFGEMIETAVKIGVPLNEQVQHPGYYYQLAAQHTGQRKLTQAVMKGPPLDPTLVAQLEKAQREFVGQPPRLRAHPLDDFDGAGMTRSIEDELESYLEYSRDYESRVDHSALIIELLTKAYEQFKKYKSSRMTLYIASQIAQEYYDVGKYDMALKFFERIAKNYRKERWGSILADILTLSLRCAKELKKMDAIAEYSLELMSSHVSAPLERRKEIQRELVNLLENHRLESESLPNNVVLDMDQINPVVEVKVQFPDSAIVADGKTPFRVFVHLNAPLPLRISSIKVTFSSPVLPFVIVDNNKHSPADSTLTTALSGSDIVFVDTRDTRHVDQSTNTVKASTNLFLAPGKIYVFQMQIDSANSRELQCASVTVNLSEDHVTLLYRIADRPPSTLMSRKAAWLPLIEGQPSEIGLHVDKIVEISSIRLLSRKPLVSLSLAQSLQNPVLLDEWYSLTAVATNQDTRPVSVLLDIDSKLSDKFGAFSEPRAYFARDASDWPQGKPALTDLSFSAPILEPNNSDRVTFHMRCPRVPGERVINIVLRYKPVNDTSGDESRVMIEEHITVVKAFHVATSMVPQASIMYAHQSLLEDIDWLSPSRSDLFFLSISVRVASSPSLIIQSVVLVPTTGVEAEKRGLTVRVVSSGVETDVSNNEDAAVVWQPNEVQNLLFRLKTTSKLTASDGILPVGFLQIKWRREKCDDADALFAVTKIPIFSAERPRNAFNVVADVPAVLRQGEVAPIIYTIRNETNRAEEIMATVEAADGFLLSGFKQRLIRLLPFTAHPIAYNAMPIHNGTLSLPLLRLTLRRGDAVQLVGPFTTFVEPAIQTRS